MPAAGSSRSSLKRPFAGEEPVVFEALLRARRAEARGRRVELHLQSGGVHSCGNGQRRSATVKGVREPGQGGPSWLPTASPTAVSEYCATLPPPAAKRKLSRVNLGRPDNGEGDHEKHHSRGGCGGSVNDGGLHQQRLMSLRSACGAVRAGDQRVRRNARRDSGWARPTSPSSTKLSFTRLHRMAAPQSAPISSCRMAEREGSPLPLQQISFLTPPSLPSHPTQFYHEGVPSSPPGVVRRTARLTPYLCTTDLFLTTSSLTEKRILSEGDLSSP